MRGRRTTSILAALCFAALTAAGASGSPRAGAGVGRVELRGVNVITGDSIAGMEVSVPRRTSIEANYFDNANVSYEGPGRIAGVALVEEGKPLRKAFQLVAVRWDFCGRPGCTSGDTTPITESTQHGGKRWWIPAGDYRLYLVADGAPVRVELRLDGLGGRTSLQPAGDVAARIAAPTAEVHPSDHLFLGRARPMVMPAEGLLIDGHTASFVGPSYTARGSCFWRGRGQEDLEHSTPGPHCLRFTERGGWAAGGGAALGGGSATWGVGTVPAGRWRSSYWATNVSAFPEVDFLTLWLAYEDPVR